jgi:predicted Zn-dependent peptidase
LPVDGPDRTANFLPVTGPLSVPFRTLRVATGLLCLLFTTLLTAQELPVQEHVLSNGMKLLLVHRDGEPNVAGGWVAHVGSSNERPGITGIAHLFEHMMFKGTPTIGTKDYAKDQQIMADQERVRDQMREEERKVRAEYRRGEIDDPSKYENMTPRWKELEKEFKKLIEDQRSVLVKNEFDQIYTAAGGSGMNAFTTEDLTAYFITVPANKLELWFWMESERLLHPVFREFYAERDVVFEERRMRTESTPLGKFGEEFNSMVWESHPYSWPVLGWPSDIPSISKSDADKFYALYYQPQNLTAILVGDFDPAKTLALAEEYLGRIPKGDRPAPDVVTLEVKQEAAKRMDAAAETNPQVDIVWHSVPFRHKDSYALDVLAQLLNGRTGRFYKGLVLGSKVATAAYAQQQSQKWAGLFNAGGEVADGFKPDDLEKGLYAELEKLKTEPVPALELQKVKNQFAAAQYRKLSANMPILYQLMFSEGSGTWREINDEGPLLQAVTAEDVMRVATKYLTTENRSVATYTRKAGTTTDADADLTGLSPEQKPVVHKFMAFISGVTDVAQLEKQKADFAGRLSAANDKSKPFITIMLKKLDARIAELKK